MVVFGVEPNLLCFHWNIWYNITLHGTWLFRSFDVFVLFQRWTKGSEWFQNVCAWLGRTLARKKGDFIGTTVPWKPGLHPLRTKDLFITPAEAHPSVSCGTCFCNRFGDGGGFYPEASCNLRYTVLTLPFLLLGLFFFIVSILNGTASKDNHMVKEYRRINLFYIEFETQQPPF